MKCPDCGKEIYANQFVIGKIEPMIPGSGRTVEHRDETYFCIDCGVNINAALTITRSARGASSSPQVIDQAVQKRDMLDSSEPQAALPGDQRRLN